MTKTCFYYGDPYKQVNKNFRYHGINSKCVKPPKPEPIEYIDIPEVLYAVETVTAKNITNTSATLEGLMWVHAGSPPAILKGFEYWPDGADYYLIVYEIGSFLSQSYELQIVY
jgi:hypothetical protein